MAKRPEGSDCRKRLAPGLGAGVRFVSTWLLLTVLLALASSCNVPGSVRPTLKIGLVAPFEGRYRYVGYEVVYGVRLALREANEAGGVAGYGVELAAYDDQGNPAFAADQARKLDVDPQVLAALGHFRYETTAAALEAYSRAGLPLVAHVGLDGGLSRGLGTEASVYPIGPDASELAEALLATAVQLSTVGDALLVTQGGPLGEAIQSAALEQSLSLQTVSAQHEGWQGQVLAEYPEVLLCDLHPVAAGEVVALLGEGAWRGNVLGGPSLAASDFSAVAGSYAKGVTFVTAWPFPQHVQDAEEFLSAYREVSNGVEPGLLALPAYEATWLLLEALNDAAQNGPPTRERMAAALSTAERMGLLGRIATGASDHQTARLYWYRIDSEGAPALIGAEAAAQAPLAHRIAMSVELPSRR